MCVQKNSGCYQEHDKDNNGCFHDSGGYDTKASGQGQAKTLR